MTRHNAVVLPQGTTTPRPKRLQVPVTEDQFNAIRRLALERRTTVAELLRAACEHAGLFAAEEAGD